MVFIVYACSIDRVWTAYGPPRSSIMIHSRIRGISSLVTACQCLLTLLLFWSWMFLFGVLIPSSDLTDLKAYGGYS
jgi:hypothetical protein